MLEIVREKTVYLLPKSTYSVRNIEIISIKCHFLRISNFEGQDDYNSFMCFNDFWALAVVVKIVDHFGLEWRRFAK